MSVKKISEVSKAQVGIYLAIDTIKLYFKENGYNLRTCTEIHKEKWEKAGEQDREEHGKKVSEGWRRLLEDSVYREELMQRCNQYPGAQKKREKIAEIENFYGKPIKELFYDWHYNQDKPLIEIGVMIGRTDPAVRKWFRKLGLTPRGLGIVQTNRARKKRGQISIAANIQRSVYGVKTLAHIKNNIRNPEFVAQLSYSQINELVDIYGVYELAGERELRKQRDRDLELVFRAKNGDQIAFECLSNDPRYRKLIYDNRSYYIVGADRQDIFQEGLIGLLIAINSFREGMSSFYSFAQLCIKSQKIDALKAATRHKHTALNSYISLNQPFCDNSNKTFEEILITSPNLEFSDPEKIYIDSIEPIEEINNGFFSDLEKNVAGLFVQGYTYKEIANVLNRNPKNIDNALSRIKRKLKRKIK